MKLVILGAQGSGKGSQSNLIAREYRLKHISTGDLVREEIEKETKEGKLIKDYSDKGKLAPDEIIDKILEKNLPKDSFILDGYPRNLRQAENLEKMSKPDKVIFLEISEKIIFGRLSERFQCVKCGIIYGINKKPKKQGVCDECGSRLEKRKDDEPEVVKKRIKVFYRNTLPLLKFYKDRLIKVDGEKSVEEVFEEIKRKIKFF